MEGVFGFPLELVLLISLGHFIAVDGMAEHSFGIMNRANARWCASRASLAAQMVTISSSVTTLVRGATFGAVRLADGRLTAESICSS